MQGMREGGPCDREWHWDEGMGNLKHLPRLGLEATTKTGPKKILVLDAGEGFEQDLAAILRALGHFPIVARMDDVFGLLGDSLDFDALFAPSMRRAENWHVVREFRDRSRSKQPICLVLTGDHSPAMARKARGMGFDHVLRKPARIATLLSFLESERAF